MSAFGLLVVVSFVGFALWLSATRPWRAVLMATFLAPWGALYVDVGLWLNAFQITIFALAIMTLLRSLYADWRPPQVPASGFLAALILYAVLASLIQIGVLPDLAIKASDGPLRGPAVRAVIQMFMFIFTLSPALLVAWLIRTPQQIIELGRTYILSVFVLALTGWLQLIIWYSTGHNPMPIGFFNIALGGSDADIREGVVQFSGLNVYRMNAFANEPRHLGGAMVAAMLMIQSMAATGAAVSRGRLFGLWIFFAVSTLATLSTSALLLWTVGSVVQFPLARLFGVRLRVSGLRIAGGILAVLTPLLLAVAVIEASGFPVLDVISARTIERIDSSGAVEDFDLAIYDFFTAHPERLAAGVGLGNIHLYATRYLDPEYQWYALGRVFTAKVQYLRFISEIGIAGLLLFLTWTLVLLIDTAAALRRPGFAALTALMPIATVMVVLFMISGSFAAEFYLLAGAMAGLCRVAGVVRHRPLRAVAA